MPNYSRNIWFDGKLIPFDKAQIHVMSHCIHYGSGVFEGIKCYNTVDGPQIFRLEDHIDRLLTSAKLYKMDITTSKEEIVNACKKFISKNFNTFRK